MLKITVFFTVAILTDVLVSHVNTVPMTGLDIQNLLQSLQKQMRKDQQSQQRNPSLYNEDHDSSLSSGRFGSLKKEDLDSIVPLETIDDKYRNNKDDSRNAARVERLARQVLEQVLQERNEQNRAESRSKKRIEVNNLLYYNKDDNSNSDEYDNTDSDSTESDDNKEDLNIGSLSDYSKVYVVLNSEAIKKSKNVNLLNDLLSSLLFARPSRARGARRRNSNKGFQNEVIRRVNRESAEDERPRRPQSHGGAGHGGRGGRGGGSNSRTAIPYMKQHGDIYERDD
ncbi:uncharacterized protein LOC113230125 [Hyposmocoma kahamanoa]|uniref:uncharacterized protein LOC113230125 n=1 Tax=Hyposmocoma kahamanoa TaxID=1477025 RepID=UPI000E6D693F|nr:uncharacterized protein LOC113230125 [Hyposmocoma kahamanoa]